MDFNTAATDGINSSETYAYQITSGNYSACTTNGDCPVGAGTNLTSLASGSTASLANETTYGGTKTAKHPARIGSMGCWAYEY